MTPAEYRRLKEPEFLVRRWRLVRAVETKSGNLIAAGSEVQVIGKRGGLEIRTLPCPHCGAAVFIRKVSPDTLEEIRG